MAVKRNLRVVLSQAEEVDGRGDGLCWECQKTDKDLCSWFDRPAVMPRGAKYYVKSATQKEDTRYIVIGCPNYKNEKTGLSCVEESIRKNAKKQQYLTEFSPTEPKKKIEMLSKSDFCKTKTAELRDYLQYVLKKNNASFNEAAKKIGCEYQTVRDVALSPKTKTITRRIYNKIADYINKEMGWD